jgi:hypothetical protein
MHRIAHLTAWILLAGFASSARADLISSLSGTATPLADGTYRYDYTLTNDTNSTLNAFSVSFALNPGDSPSRLVGPDGWDSSVSTDLTSASWLSGGPATDLAPGMTDHFSLTSALAPGSIAYVILGADANGQSFDTINGSTVGPASASPVPEPSTALIFGPVLLGSIALRLARRMARTTPRVRNRIGVKSQLS